LTYELRTRRHGAGVTPESSRFDRGMEVRREVLGAEHVARATGDTSRFDADFQRFITETAWGSVWARPGLDRRTRSLITIAILASLGRREELEMHLRATQNTGASREDVAEALLHVAVYAGVPAAHAAFGLAKAVLEGSGDDPATGGADG
jgi:4-carboxymuconolactone decarboxylase